MVFLTCFEQAERPPGRIAPAGGHSFAVTAWLLAIAFSAAVFAPASLRGQGSASYVNFEGKQTSPLRLSPDGTRLFAVNTPDARLSVFDVTQPSNPRLIAEIPVGIEPASVNPRNNDEAWVVNEVSDSVSIVSVSRRLVTDTIYVKDEPADVVFAGGMAFVSAARNNLIAVFDATSHNLITNVTVFGENPRALAVNAAGTKIYAAFALSGNHTTMVPESKAPPQSAPTNPNLPAPPLVGLIVDATNPAWYPSVINYTMPDNDVVQIDVATLAIDRYFTHVGTVNLGLAVQPGTGDLYLANTDARNLIHFEPNVRSHAVDNRITQISITTGAATAFDLNSNINYSLLPNPVAQSNALAQPTAVVFDPGGAFMYVAAFGSDRVAKVGADGSVQARIELCPTAIGAGADPRNKRGPRGLALNATAQRLYVLNRISNTLCIVDTAGNVVLKEIPIGSYDPTPAIIRQGRGFLYDAKLSGNGTMACAACHIDAEMDLIAWDLGDPGGQMTPNVTSIPVLTLTSNGFAHPMKGPMTTQTLRGLNGSDPLHWRGDRADFLAFNVAFPGLMGTSSLPDPDMAAFRDFVNTIIYEPNPNQNLDRTMPANVAGGNPNAGLNAFLFTNYALNVKCADCHPAPPGVGANGKISPAVLLKENQDFKVPQLRAIYQKMNFNNTTGSNSIDGFGLQHNGEVTLQGFLSRSVFPNIRSNAVVKNDIAAFLQCFDTGTAPAVGYSRTINATNLGNAALSNDWTLLENQAAAANIALIVKGTINGARHGLLYQPFAGNYRPDTTNLANFTRANLIAKINSGDQLTIMGVPSGSGIRMGIDRNEDGVLDGDTARPSLVLTSTPDNVVITWPYATAGYALETTTNFSHPAWTNAADSWEITNGQNRVTIAPSPVAKFYRLHSQ